MNSSRVIHVRAPARLHFGMFSFGAGGRQFGGVGAMVAEPALHLTIKPAERFEVRGAAAAAAVGTVRRCCAAWGLPNLPSCEIQLESPPRRHVGLGSGTQLACAVTAGLAAWRGIPHPSPCELAELTGRGQRSAVGTYGFAGGGLIVESGRGPGETLAPLDRQVELPGTWRFVLVTAPAQSGLSGDDEHSAFAALPAVRPAVRDTLIEEVHGHMVPAVLAADCAAFGESVYRYGRLAGSCFASIQGGPYNGPLIAELVEHVRGLGVPGVGQSSWGPTVFCIVADEQAAVRLRHALRRRTDRALDILVTPPDNRGGCITRNMEEVREVSSNDRDARSSQTSG